MAVFVTTADSKLSEPQLADAILASIWPGPEFAAERAKIAARASVHVTISQFIAELDKHVIDGPMRVRYDQFCLDTRKARDAYRPDVKPNWKAVFWPDPTHPEGRELYGEKVYARRQPFVTRATAIGSAGSCFATEIRKHLKQRGFNYIETEANDNASANWGAQYNALAFSQMVEWVYCERERPLIVWTTSQNGHPQYADAFREGVFYNTLEEIEPALREHRANARMAFDRCEVFVLTLGLVEIWKLTGSDTVLARYPRQIDPALVRGEVLTVEQNVLALERALEILHRHNPKLRLIVTVSPVPLHATFQADDRHVIEATQCAKSVLHVAVHQFAERNPDRVTYFPAFETVMWATKEPWEPDKRHVSREAVGNVMSLFEATMVDERS